MIHRINVCKQCLILIILFIHDPYGFSRKHYTYKLGKKYICQNYCPGHKLLEQHLIEENCKHLYHTLFSLDEIVCSENTSMMLLLIL